MKARSRESKRSPSPLQFSIHGRELNQHKAVETKPIYSPKFHAEGEIFQSEREKDIYSGGIKNTFSLEFRFCYLNKTNDCFRKEPKS